MVGPVGGELDVEQGPLVLEGVEGLEDGAGAARDQGGPASDREDDLPWNPALLNHRAPSAPTFKHLYRSMQCIPGIRYLMFYQY